MKQKSIKRNYIYNTANQIVQLLAPLVTTPYISRVLGAEGIGEYSFASSIIAYFTLFATMGITTYGQREISYVQDNKEKRSIVFWETKIFSIITVLICSLGYFIFLSWNQFKPIYLILYLNILSVAFDITWFYQGMEEFGKIVKRNVVLKILNICFIFLFVKNKESLLLYVAGITIFSFLGICSLWIGVQNYIEKPQWKAIKPFRNLTTILSLFVPTIAIEVYTVLDKTMIGLFTVDSAENGYYEQAIKIAKIVLTVVTALGTVMVPRIGYLFEKGENEQIQNYMYRAYRFVWFLGIPLCFGLIGVSDNFVPWFFGEGFDKVTELLMITSFLILAIGINNITGVQLLIPTKRQHIFTVTVVIGAVVNFFMNLILIPKFYSIGAAIASVVAESVIAIVQLIIARKELSIRKILYSGIHYYIAGGIMLLILWIERKYFFPSLFHTGYMVVSGMVVYFGSLFVLKDKFFLDNVKKVVNKKSIQK